MNGVRFSRAVRSTWQLLVESGRAWVNDRAMRLGAGIAYYSLFALLPALALAVSMASLFFSREQVSQELSRTISRFVDPEVANWLVGGIEQVKANQGGGLLPIVSLGALVFSATLLFVAWRDVVGIVWKLPRQHGVRAAVRRRVFGVAAIFGAGILLTLVMFAQTVVQSIAGLFGFDLVGPFWTAITSVTYVALGAVILAVLFKYSPDTDVAWRSVWLPGTVCTVLLSGGAQAYGLYVNTVGLASAAGVAGTAFLGLVVVYYAAQILLFGVEMLKISHLGDTPSP